MKNEIDKRKEEIYKRYEELLDLRKVSSYKVSKATGISTVTLSKWKQGIYTPKPDKLQLIADYFGVTLNYMLYGSEPNSEFTPEQATLDLLLSQDMELKEALRLYATLSDEKKKHIVETIKIMSEEK